jgi:hypothetical protein
MRSEGGEETAFFTVRDPGREVCEIWERGVREGEEMAFFAVRKAREAGFLRFKPGRGEDKAFFAKRKGEGM